MIGAFLFSRGYYGPVGIDVVEDTHGGQWVVDMNARTPGVVTSRRSQRTLLNGTRSTCYIPTRTKKFPMATVSAGLMCRDSKRAI